MLGQRIHLGDLRRLRVRLSICARDRTVTATVYDFIVTRIWENIGLNDTRSLIIHELHNRHRVKAGKIPW